jgi:hypothetical protein
MAITDNDVVHGLEASRRAAWAKYYALRREVPREVEANAGGWAREITIPLGVAGDVALTYGVDAGGRVWVVLADDGADESPRPLEVYAQMSLDEPGLISVHGLAEEIRASIGFSSCLPDVFRVGGTVIVRPVRDSFGIGS